MTDKPQAINVVPADDDLVERPYGSGHFALAAPGDSQEDVFLLRFADPDIREQIFMGPDAERSAWAAWNRFAPSYNCYLFRLASLSSELARCRNALEGWQPIETAPDCDDGVLICDATKPHPAVGQARMMSDGKWRGASLWGGFVGEAVWPTPTHWMPLPEPPALNPIGEEGAREP